MTEYLVHTVQRSVVIQHASSVIEADSAEQAEHIAIHGDCLDEQDVDFEYSRVISEELTDVALNIQMPASCSEEAQEETAL